VKRGDKWILEGFRSIEIPESFPVEVAEFYEGKFFVIFPYCWPRSVKLGQDEFVPHPWISPSEYEQPMYAEGVMILTPAGEYRCRTYPSGELLDYEGFRGVWEWGSAALNGKPLLFPIRPRPGKAIGNFSTVIRNTASCVCASVLLSMRTQSCHRVENVVSGPLRSLFSRSDVVLAIDSAIRDGEDYPRYASKDSNLTKLSERPTMFSRKTRLGSKMFIVDSSMLFLLVKEVPNKKWDLTGGHRELKETPWEAMKRECYEETGIVASEDRVEFLGESSATTIDEFVNSHVYLMFVDKFPEKWRTSVFRSVSWSQMPRVCLSDSVEWMNRLWSHFLTLFPTVTQFYVHWLKELQKYKIRSPIRERLLRTIDLSPEERVKHEFLKAYQSDLYSDVISSFYAIEVAETPNPKKQLKMDTGSDDDDGGDFEINESNASKVDYRWSSDRWHSSPIHVGDPGVPEKNPLMEWIQENRSPSSKFNTATTTANSAATTTSSNNRPMAVPDVIPPELLKKQVGVNGPGWSNVMEIEDIPEN